jgi:phosphoribosylpyrophosphate synthetase
MSKHILFYSPQFETLARKIARKYGDEIVLGDIGFKRFPDRTPNTFVQRANTLAAENVAFLICFDDQESFFEQLSTHYHLGDLAPKSYRVIMPFFNTATMERSTNEGQVITAKTMLRALGAVGPAGPGKVPVYIYDVHALAVKNFAGDNLAIRLKTGLKLFFETVRGIKDLTIVFPDDGAKKRFGEMEAFNNAKAELGFKTATCRKERVGDGRQIVLSEGDVEGRHAITIDDLIHSGSTLLECGRVLRRAGVRVNEAYVTHALCENDGWKNFDGSVFSRLYLTDSCPLTAQAVADDPNFVVFSLADSIANAIREGL